MPLTDSGYITKSSDEFLEDIKAELKINFPSMSESDSNPLMIIAKIFSVQLADLDSYSANAYNNVYASTAFGIHLDKIVSSVVIYRFEGTKATSDVEFPIASSHSSVTINPKFKVNFGDKSFVTTNTEPVKIDTVDSFKTIQCIALENGEVEIVENSAKAVINIPGLDLLRNGSGLSGSDLETDTNLRIRYYTAVSTFGNSSLKGVINYVLNNTEALTVSGSENITMDVGADGSPPKSMSIFTSGGADVDIAQAIFDSKPAGIETNGSITIDVEFEDSIHKIKFSRYESTEVYVEIELIKDGEFPVEGETDIKDEIIKLINTKEIIKTSEMQGVIFKANEGKGVVSIPTLKFDDVTPPINTVDKTSDTGYVFNCKPENIIFV